MDALSNPTVIASAIAAVSAIAGAIFADRVKRIVARDDALSRSAEAQYQGWDRYTGHLMKRVSDLEAEVNRKDEECDRKIAELETEMRRRDEVCLARIRSLENRLNGISKE